MGRPLLHEPIDMPTIVQSGSAAGSFGSGPFTPTWSAASAGNTLLLAISTPSANPINSAPSGYTQDYQNAASRGTQFTIYRKVAAGGETGTSFTITGSQIPVWIWLEVSGIATSTPIDQGPHFVDQGNGPTTITDTLNTTAAGEFAISFIYGDGSNLSTLAGTGGNTAYDSGFNALAMLYQQTTGGAGSVTCSGTLTTGGGGWDSVMTTYLASGGGGGGAPSLMGRSIWMTA